MICPSCGKPTFMLIGAVCPTCAKAPHKHVKAVKAPRQPSAKALAGYPAKRALCPWCGKMVLVSVRAFHRHSNAAGDTCRGTGAAGKRKG